MAQISKPPIPPKMYRHFAVVTLALTACLAIFANGENRQAVAEQVKEHQQQQELRRRSAEITTPPRLVRRDPEATTGTWGQDSDNGTFGSPIDDTGQGMHRFRSNAGAGLGARDRSAIHIPGYSQAYLDSLSDEEFDQLLAAVRASGVDINSPDRARELREADRLSAARSGSAGAPME